MANQLRARDTRVAFENSANASHQKRLHLRHRTPPLLRPSLPSSQSENFPYSDSPGRPPSAVHQHP